MRKTRIRRFKGLSTKIYFSKGGHLIELLWSNSACLTYDFSLINFRVQPRVCVLFFDRVISVNCNG